MVYCGKPSKACEPCRIRRLKCDKRRPGCSQCRNAGRVCSGYRADIDVNFRNVTDAVVLRYSSQNPSESRPPAHPPRQTWIPAPEAQLVVDTALNIAVTRFRSQNTESILAEYAFPLHDRSQCAPLLTASMQAVSLACLANEQNRPDLLTPAREKYGVALQRLGRGLQASLRSTGPGQLPFIFCSVMLLAQFAGLVSRSGEGRVEWSRHVNGAFSLLVTRVLQGPSLLTVPGQSLYLHLVSCLLLDCIQRRTTFSPQMRAILYARRSEVSEFQLRFWGLMDRMCILRAVEPPHDQCHPASSTFDNAWEDLDREVLLLMQNMPLSYSYQSPPQPNHLARNPSPVILPTTSTPPTERLLDQTLAQLDASTPEKDDPRHAKVEECREVIASVIQDICASVPSQLRYSVGDRENTESFASGWVYSLVWPLSRAAASVHCPTRWKDFIDGQMRILQERIGLDITGAQAEEWVHMFFLF
ncbi:hypothetical protein BO94DRAFT_589847 [Aspergillus sclerotioniger CBS 115572]|uniref:Zn(2)-C6 fungal-type domain-containing protein n=1 Tax=Aspergillus sclerotioniger CBS 115572 TaxID=1450535 RepID=A0A317VEB3_9EURO|nr:hypothetical protein BO94DRAFT_589847 [Aspergillus sclerotioniger CBS 115572]PWY71779.1 hypothetical protein BO94DRAFT_589847 [Aspergillus sclerotioniger CBS 115572]